MDKMEFAAEYALRVRRWHDGAPWRDPEFYGSKKFLRQTLRPVLGKNFVITIEPRTIRIFFDDKMVTV